MGKTPVKTRKSRPAQLMSSLEQRADAFVKCPAGHTLPHKTEKGKCTPLYCSMKGGTGMALGKVKDMTPEERITKVVVDEETRIKVQKSRAETWATFLQVPVDLKGADAEKYFDEEMVNLLPMALAVTKKNLLYGTEEQQTNAANKVMDANGRGKREAPGSTTPSIVINLGNVQVPTTVDGKVVAQVETKPAALTLPWRKAKEEAK